MAENRKWRKLYSGFLQIAKTQSTRIFERYPCQYFLCRRCCAWRFNSEAFNLHIAECQRAPPVPPPSEWDAASAAYKARRHLLKKARQVSGTVGSNELPASTADFGKGAQAEEHEKCAEASLYGTNGSTTRATTPTIGEGTSNEPAGLVVPALVETPGAAERESERAEEAGHSSGEAKGPKRKARDNRIEQARKRGRSVKCSTESCTNTSCTNSEAPSGSEEVPKKNNEISGRRRSTRVRKPVVEAAKSLEMTWTEDLSCLLPGNEISTSAMDLYTEWLNRQRRCNMSTEMEIVNSWFWKAAQQRKDKWTWLGQRLKDLDYLILPVHDRTHWSTMFVALCKGGCTFIHADSLQGTHNTQKICKAVVNMLRRIGGCNFVQVAVHLLDGIQQQENAVDCGVHSMFHMRQFLQWASKPWDDKMLGELQHHLNRRGVLGMRAEVSKVLTIETSGNG